MREYWQTATKEMKNVRSLTGAAFLAALSPVLGMMTITVNQYMEIGFTSLVHAMTGFLYGPVVACCVGGIADIIKFIIKPTGPFFPGFTINEMLVGFLYGIFFYRQKEIKKSRVVLSRLIITFGVNLTLTPLWLSIMYGNAFKFMVPVRLVKNILMIPVDMILLFTLLNFVNKNIKNH